MKEKVLNWSRQFNTFCFLDNHHYNIEPHAEECILAAGVKRSLRVNAGKALEELDEFLEQGSSWLFGHLAYDLKNEIEKLTSLHTSGIEFPDLFFFEPEVLVKLSGTALTIEAGDPGQVYSEIQETELIQKTEGAGSRIQGRLSRDEYIAIIKKLKKHILRGDCYEINFCTEFFSENVEIDPILTYQRLCAVSPNPFSALYRCDDQWLVCASPERWLKKTGKTILSQPIKGTSKRIPGDDERSRSALFQSAKDRSENVMVVDLVRNDLAKVCIKGSVKVDELYGIYSFPHVHQMISTVSGELEEDTSFPDIVRASFPMGSMTGAPKKKVMELIEAYEPVRRGIFSGALGYIRPDGDFDFNVVIRSMMYNERSRYLSFQAGSGITFYSDPATEWEECLLKADAIKNLIGE